MTVVTKNVVTLSLSDADFRNLVADAIARDLIYSYRCTTAVSSVKQDAGKWHITYVQTEDKDET